MLLQNFTEVRWESRVVSMQAAEPNAADTPEVWEQVKNFLTKVRQLVAEQTDSPTRDAHGTLLLNTYDLFTEMIVQTNALFGQNEEVQWAAQSGKTPGYKLPSRPYNPLLRRMLMSQSRQEHNVVETVKERNVQILPHHAVVLNLFNAHAHTQRVPRHEVPEEQACS